METAEVLAIVGGHVEEEILLRNEYLAEENEIMKSKLDKRLNFTNEEQVRLATRVTHMALFCLPSRQKAVLLFHGILIPLYENHLIPYPIYRRSIVL